MTNKQQSELVKFEAGFYVYLQVCKAIKFNSQSF